MKKTSNIEKLDVCKDIFNLALVIFGAAAIILTITLHWFLAGMFYGLILAILPIFWLVTDRIVNG